MMHCVMTVRCVEQDSLCSLNKFSCWLTRTALKISGAIYIPCSLLQGTSYEINGHRLVSVSLRTMFFQRRTSWIYIAFFYIFKACISLTKKSSCFVILFFKELNYLIQSGSNDAKDNNRHNQ